MQKSSFLISFLLTSIVLILSYTLLLVSVDPKQTVELFAENPFYDHHENFILKKRQQMSLGPKDFDTIILGSSTSEAFYPVDVDFHLNSKSFSASVGGGQTPIRFAMLKAAIDDYHDLQRIIYIVDFFEFNHNILPGEFLFNQELRRLSSSLKIDSSLVDSIQFHFSNQILESIFSVIKKYHQGETIQINTDGTTSRSMVLSPLSLDTALDADLNPEMKQNLLVEVEENFYTYSTRVLNQFEKLNPQVIDAFDQINLITGERNIEVIYILAPYQFDFKQRLFKDPSLHHRMHEWIGLFQKFSSLSHVHLLDTTEIDFSNNPQSAVWRDGIHFNRAAANNILTLIKKKL